MPPTLPIRQRPRRTSRAAAALLLISAALLSGACRDAPPQEVARGFWEAAARDDVQAMRRLAARDTWREPAGDAGRLAVRGARFGRVVIDGGQARVETTVTVDAGKALEVPLETRLLREEGAWRVDYAATMAPLAGDAPLAGILRELRSAGERLAQALDDSAGELRRALPALERDLQRLEQALQQRLPELRERIEELGRRLEELLRGPPPPSRRPI